MVRVVVRVRAERSKSKEADTLDIFQCRLETPNLQKTRNHFRLVGAKKLITRENTRVLLSGWRVNVSAPEEVAAVSGCEGIDHVHVKLHRFHVAVHRPVLIVELKIHNSFCHPNPFSLPRDAMSLVPTLSHLLL